MKKVIIFLLFSILIQLPLNCYASIDNSDSVIYFNNDKQDCKTKNFKNNVIINYINSAERKYKINDYKGALQDYDKVLLLAPISSPEIYYKRSNCKFFLSDFNGAINDCSMSIVLKSDYSDAYSFRALCKMKLNKHREAIEDCDKAIEINPEDVLAYYYKTQCEYRLNDYENYLIDLEQLRKLTHKLKAKNGANKNILTNNINIAHLDWVKGGADLRSYMETIQNNVASNWISPRDGENRICIVSFKIEKNGALKDLKIYKSSGKSLIDQAALKAIEASTPFNSLPKNYKDDFINIKFKFSSDD